MASEERTRGLLEGAGFSAVRTEQVPVRFAFRDIDEYLSVTADTAGPIGVTLRALSEDEREAVKLQLEGAFAPFVHFVVAGRYVLPGVSLTAVAAERARLADEELPDEQPRRR